MQELNLKSFIQLLETLLVELTETYKYNFYSDDYSLLSNHDYIYIYIYIGGLDRVDHVNLELSFQLCLGCRQRRHCCPWC